MPRDRGPKAAVDGMRRRPSPTGYPYTQPLEWRLDPFRLRYGHLIVPKLLHKVGSYPDQRYDYMNILLNNGSINDLSYFFVIS